MTVANSATNAVNGATNAVRGTFATAAHYVPKILKWGALAYGFTMFAGAAMAAAPTANLITGAIPAVKAMGAGAVANLPQATTVLTNTLSSVSGLLSAAGAKGAALAASVPTP